MISRRRVALTLSLLLLLVVSAQAQKQPKLIVVIVVDQMRADYLERFAPYETGGFHRFSTEGTIFANANYQHSPTETCVGHSVLSFGRNPEHTGIVSNEWYDRASGKKTYCVEDPASPLLLGKGEAVSPRNFVGDGLGDWLQASFPGARVYSISLKDRAAVLMGARHPQGAFWYSHDLGQFTTSRYYGSALPSWVDAFNQKRVVDTYAGTVWTPLLDSASPAYHSKEVASQFPHAMPKQSGRALYDAVYGSPFGDELLEAFAETVMTANQLGAHGGPDLLAISFSSNDAVGHTYGPDSPEIADEQIRLDRTLGRLMSFVNQKLGKENVLWALSADHGAEPAPEGERELEGNAAAQRLPFSAALKSIEAQMNAIFHISGEMHWFAATVDTMLYFDRAQLSTHKITLEAARHALTTQVHDVPGIAGFYDASTTGSPEWMQTFVRNSNYPERSGDVYYLTKEWTYFSSQPTGTSHGDPWPYDTHVPFAFVGWQVRPQHLTEDVQVTDFAPTLAGMIGISASRSEKLDGTSRAKSILKSK
jgi:predicted AlkP superfamily pyrophosphatase or phosphodiesterase